MNIQNAKDLLKDNKKLIINYQHFQSGASSTDLQDISGVSGLTLDDNQKTKLIIALDSDDIEIVSDNSNRKVGIFSKKIKK